MGTLNAPVFASVKPTAYTPVLSAAFGVATGINCWWFRMGRMLYVKFRFSTASTGGGIASIDIPVLSPPITIDTAFSGTTLGHAWSSCAAFPDIRLKYQSATTMYFFSGNNNTGSSMLGNDFGNTVVVDGWFYVPITEWS